MISIICGPPQNGLPRRRTVSATAVLAAGIGWIGVGPPPIRKQRGMRFRRCCRSPIPSVKSSFATAPGARPNFSSRFNLRPARSRAWKFPSTRRSPPRSIRPRSCMDCWHGIARPAMHDRSARRGAARTGWFRYRNPMAVGPGISTTTSRVITLPIFVLDSRTRRPYRRWRIPERRIPTSGLGARPR